jgi:hypothetical protein
MGARAEQATRARDADNRSPVELITSVEMIAVARHDLPPEMLGLYDALLHVVRGLRA